MSTDLELLEQRVAYLERRVHVHPKWRWLQLVAWIVGALLVAGAFAVQGRNIDVDARTQHDACVGIVKNLDGIIAVANVEANEGDHLESPNGQASHVLLRRRIDTLQASRSELLDSRLCNGVDVSDLADD